ncbi:MAG TPA: hypothetical protein VGR46_03270 [Candidatus Limnocylindria bacterium]|jgi:hypothetical protein|nr:hypothetical protein [Candidatus Limnocylindria bacterium]
MLPELSIERIFRREIDSLPLPAEGLWIPDRPTAGRSIPLTAVVIAATVLLVLGAVVTVREAGDAAATTRRGATTAPLQNLARPTCLRGGCNVYRSDAFGYGIVIPGDWRVIAPALPSPLHGRTPPDGALDRVEFTGLTPNEWTAASGANLIVPWDVVIEVHERRGILAMDWARTDGCGSNPCVTGQTTIGGSPAYVASWSVSPSLRMHAYYIERGDRMLILRYVTGPGTEDPRGITERTLEQIVGSLALS